ncbi:MAG: TonB-dependent receptor, partial [Gammaproteobacteria bacterium]|nr:TonB-dependent receptor [Gammaproteobacteria bacterium]
DDRATRGAGLGRIYQELGFEQLALKEATRSISVDQTNAAAHRLLADAYLSKARHEIARVSELLQSQMLQSINTAPLQPQMGESTLTLLNNLGTGNATFNDYNSLFMRNRIKLNMNVLGAGNNTTAGEIIASGVMNNFSISAGKYSYKTDGFHSNNEDDQLLENVFMQYAVTSNTSLLFEASTNKREYGDLLRFDPNNFSQTLNNLRNIDRRRVGITHKFASHSKLLVTSMQENRLQQRTQGAGFFTFTNQSDIDSTANEFRYLYSRERGDFTFGYSLNKSSSQDISTSPFGPPSVAQTVERDSSAYAYFYPTIDNIMITAGLSRSHFQTTVNNRDSKAYSKKFGLELDAADADMVFRMAYFETFRRPIVNNQTLEPTSISGFNQFYDDRVGTDARNIAFAIDNKINKKFQTGLEYIDRDLSVPFVIVGPVPSAGRVDWRSTSAAFYTYWLPRDDMSVNIGLVSENLERDTVIAQRTNQRLISSKIFKLPIGINWFHSSGWVGRTKLTYIRQRGNFVNVFTSAISEQKDDFAVVDASIEYRFRDGRGSFTIGALNLFDKSFRYQDADPNRQIYAPGRIGFVRISFAF